MTDLENIGKQILKYGSELPDGVKLVAVSKFHPVEALRAAYDAGQRIFGESRVQEIQQKHRDMPEDVEWHFIGHLQTNKVRQVVGKVDLIQSVDRLPLLACIEKEAAKLGIVQDILLEINIGEEESKSGFRLEEIDKIAEEMGNYPHCRLRGLMAIPPVSEKSGDNCRFFAQIRRKAVDISAKKQHNIRMDILSMGMTDDFEDAIAEGSTMIRVGTAIFGARNYNL